ncbi:hypothetical protein L593_02115 [Salinarchaeum sp. Harcht-Bsk1]|nr:hypothetical protein L593_02115 [Salinarchaeum sp. Harcht-Bsk1]
MSNGPPDHSQDELAPPPGSRLLLSARRASETFGGPLRAIAFWCAAMLPFVYVPLLLFGLDTRRRAGAFGLLVFAHVVTLVVGRSHGAE